MSEGKNKESIWLNLGVNVILPTIILMKAQKWLVSSGIIAQENAKPIYFFAIAIALPLFYGIYDLAKRGKWNIFSIFGILNVLLTGTIGLFELSRGWIIAKEAGIPAILGLAVLISAYTKKPLVKILIYNDTLLDTKKVAEALEERNNTAKFFDALKGATILISASFFASGIIQFFLAAMIYTENASAEEFNSQVGQMTWISYLVVLLPCMAITAAALFKILNAIKNLTGFSFEEVLSQELRENKK
ncbi:MAG: hypothetical protein J6R08_07495 [Opitutales bacterium]|nr:hypothetical protein [Opitutales bacterium]